MIKLLLIGLTAWSACISAQENKDGIFHYSSMDAMRNGVYTGNLTVKDVKKKGDFGLGTYNFLDGELVMLDGSVYRIVSDGSVEIADHKREIPFGSFTFFKKEHSEELRNVKTVEELMKNIREILPSSNRFYAIKIEAVFKELTLGGAIKVNEEDRTGIADLMKTRPLYINQNIKGTLVGFYSPSYVGGLDLSPFHFHFISEDRKVGGHLVEGTFAFSKFTVQLDEKNTYEVMLPNNDNKGYRSKWESSGANSQY
ncbi:acetolactate decarboxylase [Chryseobacterium sp. Tr-659]|uniref:acetolactate decarboxylase n=1 Tax=Chryseobacterium sp. Tr-659 TaxID=2608340 RepID=UPI00141F118D|nr:acetolactate decarboxylase [Chryseobacterium sp. Tr-659]NIF07260.1 acetolactate decarboxylase [Chryseobacterium sp. Tr-659]